MAFCIPTGKFGRSHRQPISGAARTGLASEPGCSAFFPGVQKGPLERMMTKSLKITRLGRCRASPNTNSALSPTYGTNWLVERLGCCNASARITEGNHLKHRRLICSRSILLRECLHGTPCFLQILPSKAFLENQTQPWTPKILL